MKQVSFIYNPTAGALRHRAGEVSRFAAALSERGLHVAPCATAAGGDATRLARRAVEQGAAMLIVGGGDGTINEAAQALVGSETALAVWPCGTANVLAKDLGLPRRTAELADLIATGPTRTISVGRACKPETDWQRYFLLMAGIGLDAAIVQGVDLELKRRFGIGAYWAASLDYLVRWPLTPFSLAVNGQRYEATFAAIANAPSYGGGFRLAPRARLEEDKLDVCLFNSRRRLDYLNYALLGLTGRHTRNVKVVYQETQEVLANSNPEALVQLDGDLAGSLPMRFESVPHALRVVAP
jgi:YegS/Rv2252/BmrU family lipid kinase